MIAFSPTTRPSPTTLLPSTPRVLARRVAASLVLSGAFLAAACGGGSTATDAASSDTSGDERTAIVGAWRSSCVPQGEAQSFSLDFDITDARWSLDYDVFGDTACGAAFLTVHIEGPYEIGGPSTVEGAREARFGFDRKTVTAHAEAAAGYLSSLEGCGDGAFTVGEAEDISVTGCAPLGQRPIAACGQDYDLVAVDATSLRFGARPADNDLCTPAARPTELSPLAMSRVE
jgi:hypothetical protein